MITFQYESRVENSVHQQLFSSTTFSSISKELKISDISTTFLVQTNDTENFPIEMALGVLKEVFKGILFHFVDLSISISFLIRQ